MQVQHSVPHWAVPTHINYFPLLYSQWMLAIPSIQHYAKYIGQMYSNAPPCHPPPAHTLACSLPLPPAFPAWSHTQARNLVALRPTIEAAGYKLVVVSIGYPQAGREFCEKLPFPPGVWVDLQKGVGILPSCNATTQIKTECIRSPATP
jgi:hypothetical protein